MNISLGLLIFTLGAFPLIGTAHELNPRVIERITGEKIVYDHHEIAKEAAPDPDPRVASRRFYTLPEWHIVYTAIEYGEFAAGGGQPSQFPYFKNTQQLWNWWRLAEASAAELPDPTTNTVLYTIAVSTTVEQWLIGIYEGSIGWLFEKLDFGLSTPEDIYTNMVAQEYGSFLLHTPWYEFPYSQKLIGLWTTWGVASVTPRGVERRLIFTVAYGVKGLYAAAINYASSQEYEGGAGLETDVVVHGDSLIIDTIPFDKKSVDLNGFVTLSLPRYRAFLEAVHTLGKYPITIESIMGHEDIAFSVVQSGGMTCESIAMYEEFSQPILTKDNESRVVYDVPVTQLISALDAARACGITVEHIYDF